MAGHYLFTRKRNPVHEMWDYLRTECYRRCLEYNDYLRLCDYSKKKMESMAILKFSSPEDVAAIGSYLIEDMESIRWAMRGTFRGR